MDRAPDPTPDVPAGEEPGSGPPTTHRHHPFVLLAAVLVVALVALGVRAVEPSQPGAFYTPSTPVAPEGAGTIIRSEPLETAPRGARGWRVLYRSTGLDGQAIAVSGTVFAPLAPAPAGGRPVVAWAHPTTGVASRCAPSIGADGGAGTIPGLGDLLEDGYVVAATDYPGLGTPGPHPYLVGESEGPAVLDGVRAATHLDGADARRQVALWGHSQGGHAVLFAGQMAPTYAPDLDVVGVAAAAPATSLGELLRRDIGGVTGNVLASMALTSWSQVYADRGLSLEAVVEREAMPLVELISANCIETTSQEIIDLPAAEVLRVRFLEADPWAIPPWDDVLTENTPGAVPLTVPVLIAQGTADTVVWPGVTADWVAAQCRAGVTVDERRYEGRTHTEIAVASADDVRAWIGDRVAGRRAPSTCAATGSSPT